PFEGLEHSGENGFVHGEIIARSQKPEARSQKPEARSQKPEARSQKPDDRSQKTEARSQKPEGRSKKQEATRWTAGAACLLLDSDNRQEALLASDFSVGPSDF
ncbi:MAG TPA: hypothetical protein VLN08_04620, partial [Vicinamibacterales bacterium]|nr:hypothetical protein [Vicinamibacterales bacterium]